ncbi:diadenosine tetraphosphatase [Mycolicibacterium conceptionense]|uniref:Diadenosine tetraphosphatase n=1 Tax=Mycolicibacterium conceptionense TaxID=451644 RepID=A0A0J8U8I3_9MYCO|nr:diadenosine tetraphosphatase [Mycolicibacterium conceptionense]
MIVSAHEHYEHLDEMPAGVLAAFMADVTRTSRAVRSLDGVERVNVAVLGNREPHVHAHVIPRRAGEVNAGKAPWDEAPPRRSLNDWNRLALTRQLRSLLDES